MISIFVSLVASAQEAQFVSSSSYKVEPIYQGAGVVWGFDFVNADKMLVSHRQGDLFLYDIKSKKKTKLSSPEVYAKGQGGLLDVKLKKIDGKDYVYLTYIRPQKNGKAVTALARGELKGDKLMGLETIFISNADGDGSIHFGSRLAFDGDSLFMSVGERGERDLAQDIHKHNGSILRLTLDGKAYPQNPFVGKDGLDEIYSIGHRNPQGIDFDPLSKKLYNVEMGPRGGDELNQVEKGKNYGWPLATYGREYYGPKIGSTSKQGTEQPVAYWVPSISPSAMVFYTGDRIKDWKNNVFLACLSGQQVRRLVMKDGKVEKQFAMFTDMDERFRNVSNGADGLLYLSTDSGKIFRVSNR